MDLIRKIEEFEKGHNLSEVYSSAISTHNYKYFQSIGIGDTRFVDSKPYHLIDDKGTEYLDFIAGFATCHWGRKNPVINRALVQAASSSLPNMIQFGIPPLAAILAHEILELTKPHFQRVFFLNTGSEATEYALKMAMDATGKKKFVYLTGDYHGLTLGSLLVNGATKHQKIFAMQRDNYPIKFNDADALREIFKRCRKEIAGVIIEPVQGRTGEVASDEFLREARRLCDKHGAFLIYDEVKTGFGRTGKMFFYEWSKVSPDIMYVAKGLSGGEIPISAVLYTEDVYKKVFSFVDKISLYSSTFRENNFSMAAGLAVMEIIRENDFLPGVLEREALVRELFESGSKDRNYDATVKGKGLLLTVSIDGAKKSLSHKLLDAVEGDMFYQMATKKMFEDKKILCMVPNRFASGIAIIPALSMPKEHIVEFCTSVLEVFDEMLSYSNLKFLKETYKDLKTVL